MVSLNILATAAGAGLHVWALTSEQVVQATKVSPPHLRVLQISARWRKQIRLYFFDNPESDFSEHLLRYKRRSYQTVHPPALRSSLRPG